MDEKSLGSVWMSSDKLGGVSVMAERMFVFVLIKKSYELC